MLQEISSRLVLSQIKKTWISFNKWCLNEIFKIPLISQELKSRPCLVQIKLKKGHLTKCNEFFAK
jgi:hypothetical protein